MFGPDEDETGAAEVHEWMTAHRAESDDDPPAPCPHLDRVGARRDSIADDPFTRCYFVTLVCWLPVHPATSLTALLGPSFAARTCRVRLRRKRR